MQSAAARRASGVREEVSGDDKFIRRSSYNQAQINAVAMASQLPPPVVDVNDYVAPPATGTYYITVYPSLQSSHCFRY